MTSETVHAGCPYRIVIVKGLDHTRSVETSRSNEREAMLTRHTVPLHPVAVSANGIISDTVTRTQCTSTRKSGSIFGSALPPLSGSVLRHAPRWSISLSLVTVLFRALVIDHAPRPSSKPSYPGKDSG